MWTNLSNSFAVVTNNIIVQNVELKQLQDSYYNQNSIES